jgi:hypothetical protein
VRTLEMMEEDDDLDESKLEKKTQIEKKNEEFLNRIFINIEIN